MGHRGTAQDDAAPTPASGPFVRMSDVHLATLPSGVRAAAFTMDRMSAVYAVIEAGVSAAPHAHEHEQCGVLLEGEVYYTIGAETLRLEAGDGFFIPSHAMHSVEAITRAVMFEVFAPPRADYGDLSTRAG
jgi:quercetin dioxygenase-like cupin family protein